MSRSALLETWVAEAIEAVPTAISPVGLQLVRGGVITDLPGYADGQFYVEDEAAQLVPPLLDVQPGQLVLDACAAPGGKATHLAALMKNQGEIVAVDRAAARLTRVMDNCRRLGVTIVRPVVGDVANLPGGDSTAATSTWPSLRSIAARGRPFDRILLDAPCSGLGVLRRHPEGKWYKQAETIARHRETQRRLLEATSRLLRPDGVLVYSTCSVEPEETESIIDEFCQSHRDFQRESVAPWVPPTGLPFVTPRGDLSTMANMNSMDAFFAARLRRSVE